MNSRIASASRRHVAACPEGTWPVSLRRTARSNATQHIIFEWVKCSASLRTSQMPESGWRQMRQTRSAIAASRRPVSRSTSPARLRVDQSGLQQVAVDVQLGLRRGVVADPDGARPAVAVQLERAFGARSPPSRR